MHESWESRALDMREAARAAVERAHGALKGVWGTTHDEIQAAIDRDRASWDRDGIG